MARTQRQGKRQSNARKQARAVRTKPATTTLDATTTVITSPTATTTRSARPYQATKSTTPARKPVVTTSLPRELEYGFIREDLIRLLITAGILTVAMIALLLVIDR